MHESLFVKGLGGEKKLRGVVTVGTAKNAVLKAMAASTLFDDNVVLEDVPDIEDVRRMAELIEALGATVIREGGTYHITTPIDIQTTLDSDISGRLRSSIVLTGPLLSRFGRVSLSHPGGCLIGERPIDFFLSGFEKLGAEVSHDGTMYHIVAKDGKLHGNTIFFPTPTHTGTETMMMAAVRAEGVTTLKNCAMEPEIVDLAHFLNDSGAHIVGAGTPTIHITGVQSLKRGGRSHRSIADRIEAGSFLILGALCAEELEVKGVNPDHLDMLIDSLERAGVPITVAGDSIVVKKSDQPLRPLNIKTHEYPGFATDLQAPMTVFLTQAEGDSLVHETIFEGRLGYTQDLVRMGAHISMWDAHRAQVKGKTALKGRTLGSPDLRAGLAFVIAAAVAEGNSLINNVYYIDRGYERIEERLRALGLDITRTTRIE